jgi:hypothetical protein
MIGAWCCGTWRCQSPVARRTWPGPQCCATSHDNIAKALRHNARSPHTPVKLLLT